MTWSGPGLALSVVLDKQKILQNIWVADIQNKDIIGLDLSSSENKV